VAIVVLFGPARTAADTSSVHISGRTVAEVLHVAEARYGRPFVDVVAESRIWVNGEPAHRGTSVSDADEIAILPPVSGG
jgi:molybdopterin converting factor small subunit